MTEQEKRIADFFTGPELVEYLNLSVIDIVFAFKDDVDDAMDELEELMNVRRESKP